MSSTWRNDPPDPSPCTLGQHRRPCIPTRPSPAPNRQPVRLMRLSLVMIADIQSGSESAFQRYESLVLPLLERHGGPACTTVAYRRLTPRGAPRDVRVARRLRVLHRGRGATLAPCSPGRSRRGGAAASVVRRVGDAPTGAELPRGEAGGGGTLSSRSRNGAQVASSSQQQAGQRDPPLRRSQTTRAGGGRCPMGLMQSTHRVLLATPSSRPSSCRDKAPGGRASNGKGRWPGAALKRQAGVEAQRS